MINHITLKYLSYSILVMHITDSVYRFLSKSVTWIIMSTATYFGTYGCNFALSNGIAA